MPHQKVCFCDGVPFDLLGASRAGEAGEKNPKTSDLLLLYTGWYRDFMHRLFFILNSEPVSGCGAMQ
jgi:hypothetical protein